MDCIFERKGIWWAVFGIPTYTEKLSANAPYNSVSHVDCTNYVAFIHSYNAEYYMICDSNNQYGKFHHNS